MGCQGVTECSSEFENTVGLGKGKKYSRLQVSPGAYMFPAWDLNYSYEETDVFISMAKLKNHAIRGVTLSMKNLYGCTQLRSTAAMLVRMSPTKTPKATAPAWGTKAVLTWGTLFRNQ